MSQNLQFVDHRRLHSEGQHIIAVKFLHRLPWRTRWLEAGVEEAGVVATAHAHGMRTTSVAQESAVPSPPAANNSSW